MPVGEREQLLYDATLEYVGTICRDMSALRHIVAWGITDADSWLASNRPRPDGLAVSALPFDGQGRPKAVAQALLDAFALRTPA